MTPDRRPGGGRGQPCGFLGRLTGSRGRRRQERPEVGMCLAGAPGHWNWTPWAEGGTGRAGAQSRGSHNPSDHRQSSSWAPSPNNQLLPGQSPGCPGHLRSPHVALHSQPPAGFPDPIPTPAQMCILASPPPYRPQLVAGHHLPRLSFPWPQCKVLS